MNLNTRQLRAFLHLVREKSFTRAAASSYLSQPAFSALIRQLEDDVGVRLFDRTTRQVELTREGEEFEVSARRLLEEFDHAMSEVRDSVAIRRGRVSIALLPSLAADWLPPVLAQYHEQFPGVELRIADVLSEACVQAVKAGQADFALAATRVDSRELQAELFCSDRFHLVCRADHPLATSPSLRPKDLAQWPFVQLSRTSSVRQHLDAAMHPNTLRQILEVDQLASVSGMVSAGLGISVVPALSLYQFQSPELAIRPLNWRGLKRDIYLIRRREKSLSIAAQRFYEWVMANRPKSRLV
ncbi:LysR substrate-binding domain-containing protein [Hydrogenophaga sp. 5NK40-0174]|uniref:LysR family transcriptional regulator n=1 Tax=Hydrogenophaga sp. 5NK40-0174 TaxID=3127649 RepID=UPI00333E3B71